MNNFMKVSQKSVSQSDVKAKTNKTTNKTENGTDIVMPGQETDKDMFLKLLVAQMGNQDPMNPQDPTQYITQLAQFSTLEQMQSMNDGMEYLVGLTNGVLVNSAMGTASGLIGKQVEVYAPKEAEGSDKTDNSDEVDDKKTLTGIVEGIKIENGIVYMEVRVDGTGELKSVEYGSLIKASDKK